MNLNDPKEAKKFLLDKKVGIGAKYFEFPDYRLKTVNEMNDDELVEAAKLFNEERASFGLFVYTGPKGRI